MGAHEAVATVPVERALDLDAHPGHGALERVPHVGALLAHLDHLRLAAVPPQRAGVVGLAAAGRVEDRGIERHARTVHIGDRGTCGPHVRVVQIQQFSGHRDRSLTELIAITQRDHPEQW